MIDLHVHSWYSEDGEASPEWLVQECAEKGISALAITDHNCVKAHVAAAREAEKNHILYIPGIEVDCCYSGINIQVLGYGIDFWSDDFQKLYDDIEERSFWASLEMLEQTQIMGFHITEQDMWELSRSRCRKDTWTGEMFAEVLLKKPEYLQHPLLCPYRPGGKRSDNPYSNFYWDFYAQGKLCHVPMKYPVVDEVVDLIHRNHGAAVLAHPGISLKKKEKALDIILKSGMDGMEVFTSYHTSEQIKYFSQAAAKNKLIITCGSNYHGKVNPSVALGEHFCPLSDEVMLGQLGIF